MRRILAVAVAAALAVTACSGDGEETGAAERAAEPSTPATSAVDGRPAGCDELNVMFKYTSTRTSAFPTPEEGARVAGLIDAVPELGDPAADRYLRGLAELFALVSTGVVTSDADPVARPYFDNADADPFYNYVNLCGAAGAPAEPAG